MKSLTLDCPAKINLFLEVLGKRPDGYHDLATVMVPLDWADTLEIREARRFRLEVEGADLPGVNTVTRAWEAVRRRRRVPPVRARLVKRIPAGSGLGGGSSDAAAALEALDRLFGLGLDLAGVGAEVGSDVNFFLQRGAALCLGRGETVIPLAAAPPLHAVVVWPGFPLSTAEVYGRLKTVLTRTRRSVIDFLNSLARGGLERVGRALFNRLESAAFALRPELKGLLNRLRRAPVAGARLTGSGSAFYGLCASRAEAEGLARRVCRENRMSATAVSFLPRGMPWKSPRSASS